jgi:hypothetical protein
MSQTRRHAHHLNGSGEPIDALSVDLCGGNSVVMGYARNLGAIMLHPLFFDPRSAVEAALRSQLARSQAVRRDLDDVRQRLIELDTRLNALERAAEVLA